MHSEMLEGKYKGKLLARYEQPQHSVVAQVFRGLAGKKVVTPSKDFSSHHQQSGVKCSIKANEGHLFCLDKSFMFVPKPATYISFDTISVIVMSRVGGAVSASRTFDITITTKNGGGEHQFSNINRYDPTYTPPSLAKTDLPNNHQRRTKTPRRFLRRQKPKNPQRNA